VWEEREVYIHLYQATSSTYSSTAPLWSGFVLMDLSARKDEGFPFDIELTATDGLSLLKEQDWTNVALFSGGTPATLPYDSGDVNWGPTTFLYWVKNLLRRAGMGGTAEGASENYEYSTSVNWYNQGHPAVSNANDPLDYTRGKMTWTHSEDSGNVFNVLNCYDVLKEVLRAWGCRVTYWQHCFYIVQIDGYTTTESGNLAAPVNIPTRRYPYNSQTAISTGAYLGNLQLTRYALEINDNLTDGIPDGIVALKGTKFTHYPAVKEVNATLFYGGEQNYFGGFPEFIPVTFTNPDAPTSNPVAQRSMIDASTASEMRLNFNLEMKHEAPAAVAELRGWQRFYIKAENDAGTSTKYLRVSGTNTGFSWTTSTPSMTQSPMIQFDHVTRNYTSQNVFDYTFPTHADFIGLWHFEIHLAPTSWPNTGSYGTTGFYARKQNQNSTSPHYNTPYITAKLSWRNAPISTGGAGNFTVTTNAAGAVVFTGLLGNPFNGSFELVNDSTSGSTAVVITNTVATTNSEKYDLGLLYYGDCDEETSEGNLMVSDDGTNWVKSAFGGEWGVGTISGTTKFTQLLAQEFFSGQAENIQIFNGRIALGVNGKTTTYSSTEYANFINPIGRLQHLTDYYIFRRGVFHTALDEWDYEGWVIKDATNTLTTTSQDIWKSGFIGGSNGGGYSARLMAPPSPDSSSLAADQIITTTSSQIAASAGITSIPIDAIGTAIFKDGDVCNLINARTGFNYNLTLAADQGASDTSLTIDAYDFSADPEVEAGALIYLNTLDLTAQYQHKTKGTIGGMVVTSTSIGKATSVGRQTVFFRFEGDNLSEGTYYVSNGEDNNKSGRWGSTNTNAPSTIGTQRAIKSGRFVADVDYKMEGGSCVASGTTGYTVDISLYKTTPVDGATAATAMTAMGRFTVALDTDSRTQVDLLTSISTDTINANDIIIPHIHCGGEAGGTFDLRGVISFTLIRS